MKIYTKTGDDGSTGLQGSKRIMKSNIRIKAYGAVDEINASIGLILSSRLEDSIEKLFKKIQNDLFVVGSDLSNTDLSSKKNRVTLEMVENIEKNIDQFEKELPPLTNFILPGGDEIAARIHLSRAITRRAETQIISLDEKEKVNEECKKYVNRLSDLLFVIARIVNNKKGIKDNIWKP